MHDNKTDLTPALDVRGLVKSFGANRVLDNISLKVASGATVCVLGRSGSGKSTLLRCINFLSPPDAGEIYLKGTRVGLKPGRKGVMTAMSDWELARVRTRIGMVFQHFNLC